MQTLKLMIAALVLVALPATAQNDPWLAKDKALHFGAGWAVAEATMLATGTDRDRAALAGCAVGLAKEVYDKSRPDKHVASVKDLLATCAGAWIGPRFRGFLGEWLIRPKADGVDVSLSVELK